MTQTHSIIFDLDGTLIHSAPDLHMAINGALGAVGRAPLELDTVISFIGNGVDVLVERSLRHTGPHDAALQATVLEDFRRRYEADMTTLTRPYAGVVETLTALRAEGFRLGICTNKPDAPARRICDALDLSRHFDVIQGVLPDQPKKPDAAPLLRCISALGGTAERAIYVGDSIVDYQTAQNAGVAFRLFRGGYPNADPAQFNGAREFDVWSAKEIAAVADPSR